MAIHINEIAQINSNDSRLIESCLRLMCTKGFTVPLTVSSASEGAAQINQVIANWSEKVEEKKQFVRWMLEEAKQKLLPLSELDWIKGNDRICYWVWLHLLRSQYFAHPLHPTLPVPVPVPVPGDILIANTYNQLNLALQPTSTKARFNEIVKYLDRVGQPLEWQRNLIIELKLLCKNIFAVRKPLQWLKNEDEEQCWWAWEYLNKVSNAPNRPIVRDIYPMDLKELYLAIYAAIDAWVTNEDSMRLFLSDFNKAWQQKRHRDNRQDKKACNLVLREEVKKKLDEMAKKRGMKLNQLVEMLIEQDYERLNS